MRTRRLRESEPWFRQHLAGVLLVLTPLLGLGGCGGTEKSMLVVTFDTTRRDFISVYGADPKISPNIAALAETSTTFLDAYSQANVTNPSHVTIMTGLTALQHGVFDNEITIPSELDTLPLAFQRAGFETAAFPAASHVGQDAGWRGYDRLVAAKPELNAARVTDGFLSWLEGRESDRPFFAWLHYFDPHAVYQPPKPIRNLFYDGDPSAGSGPRLRDESYFDKVSNGPLLRQWLGDCRDPDYPAAMYAAEIHFADRELGRALSYLDENGLSESTVIVLVADHGETLSEHGIWFGHRGLYETNLRIPFIARVPGFPPGIQVEARVTHLDIAPTIAELFDISLQHDLPGRSLVPLLEGDAPRQFAERGSFIHESAHNLQVAHRRGSWKLIWPIKKNHPILTSEPLLYNLEADPDELESMADERPELVRALQEDVEPWISIGSVQRGEDVELDEETRDRLKALGYLQ